MIIECPRCGKRYAVQDHQRDFVCSECFKADEFKIETFTKKHWPFARNDNTVNEKVYQETYLSNVKDYVERNRMIQKHKRAINYF